MPNLKIWPEAILDWNEELLTKKEKAAAIKVLKGRSGLMDKEIDL